VPLVVAGTGTVTAVGGWLIGARLARKNTLQSNKHNNTLKERNEIYASCWRKEPGTSTMSLSIRQPSTRHTKRNWTSTPATP